MRFSVSPPHIKNSDGENVAVRGEKPDDSTVEELMEKSDEIQELNQSIEDYIEEKADRQNYYSINITLLNDDEVRLEVYGVEGSDYPLPDRELVAEAVADQYSWEPGFDQLGSENNMYRLSIFDAGDTA